MVTSEGVPAVTPRGHSTPSPGPSPRLPHGRSPPGPVSKPLQNCLKSFTNWSEKQEVKRDKQVLWEEGDGARRPLTSYCQTSPLRCTGRLVNQATEAYARLWGASPTAWSPASPSSALYLPLPLAAGTLSACAFPCLLVLLVTCSLCEPTCA